MAGLRLRRRSPLVRLMVLTLVMAVVTMVLLVLQEPLLSDLPGRIPQESSGPSYNTHRTLRKLQDNIDVPHLVFEEERNIEDGTSPETGKRKNFESTLDVVVRGFENQGDHEPLTSEYRETGHRIDTSNPVRSTLIFQTPTVTSVNEQDTHIHLHTINSSYTTENNQTYQSDDYNQGYNNHSHYDYYDYNDNHSYDDYYSYNTNNTFMKYIFFTKTLFFCEYIFSAIYEEYTTFTDNISYGNSSLSLITDEKFLDICKPFWQELNVCEEKGFITICESEEIAYFVHPHRCQKPSSEDLYFHHLLVATLLEEDDACFQAVCEGRLRVVEREVEEVLVRLISPNVASCHKYLLQYYQQKLNETKDLYRTRNRYWPCCFPGYDVVWIGDPEALASVVKGWSYLPSHCRSGEGFLVMFVMCVVVGGVMGNLLVVILLIRGGDEGRPSTMIRISLASSDLLLSLFVLAPSLYEHLYLIYSTNSPQTPATDVDEVDGGFKVFSALMMSLCCIISQLNLFVLSFQRFRSPNESVLLTPSRMKGFVIVTWTSSLLVSLLLICDEDRMVVGLWYSFNKLIFGASPQSMKILLPIVTVILGIVCLLTGVFSVQAVRNHMKARKAVKHEEIRETGLDQTGDQSHHVTLIIMTVISICSTLMGGLACVLHLSAVSFAHMELIRYLSWWVFLGATACNPWFCNLPNQQFRDDAAAFLSILAPRTVLEKAIRWYRFPRRTEDVELCRANRYRARRQRHLPGFGRINVM